MQAASAPENSISFSRIPKLSVVLFDAEIGKKLQHLQILNNDLIF